MLISLNWIKEYLKIDGSKIPSNEKISHILTMAGFEVESILEQGKGIDQVIVAKVEKKEKHPNADRLSLCQVTDGKNKYDVVCGAANVRAGLTVAFAPKGTVLPNGLKIKTTKIRGVESNGMICSESELGLSKDSEGIMELSDSLKVGSPVKKELKLDDSIFDLAITANRGDCFSHIGIAREFASNLNTSLKYPAINLKESNEKTSSHIGVAVSRTGSIAPRYMGRIIKGIKIGESPAWLKTKLQAVGLRPINNIVDVTNFVLMEYGQPLHAFDFDKIRDGKIYVKAAKKKEKFKTLDGIEREIEPGDILICDSKDTLALGGVMGGENSEVTESTQNIFLESAVFNPVCIRRTTKRLGLQSDSAFRFERGVDFKAAATALDRAASLIQELAGGKVYKEPVDIFKREPKSPNITLDLRTIRKLSGINFTSEQIMKLLSGNEIDCSYKSRNVIRVNPPSWRHDLKRGIDLVEEVIRLHGYEHVPTTYPSATSAYLNHKDVAYEFSKKTRQFFVGAGFNEAINYSFLSPQLLKTLRMQDNVVELKNPLSLEWSVLRPSLIPSLIQNIKDNENHFNFNLRLFEIGKSFIHSPGIETKTKEINLIAGIMSGLSTQSPQWNNKGEKFDFYDVKGYLEQFFAPLNLGKIEFAKDKNGTHPILHPGQSAVLISKRGNVEVGYCGKLHPKLEQVLDLNQSPIFLFELNFDWILKHTNSKLKFKEISKYPGVKRDLALEAPESMPASEIIQTIEKFNSPILKDFQIFDQYIGSPLPDGIKSIAISFTYQSNEKTLTDDEINEIQVNLVTHLADKLPVRVRQ